MPSWNLSLRALLCQVSVPLSLTCEPKGCGWGWGCRDLPYLPELGPLSVICSAPSVGPHCPVNGRWVAVSCAL